MVVAGTAVVGAGVVVAGTVVVGAGVVVTGAVVIGGAVVANIFNDECVLCSIC